MVFQLAKSILSHSMVKDLPYSLYKKISDPIVNRLFSDKKQILEKANQVLPAYGNNFQYYRYFSNNNNYYSFYINWMSKEILKYFNGRKKSTTPVDIVIIGVHGWFPSKILQTFVGEAVGTSEKFCQMLKQSLERYFAITDNISNIKIASIPLSGNGKIMDKVDKFYNILTSGEHKEMIKNSTHILIPTHSQGTIVSIFLLQKLMNNKIITSNQKTGILCMAGIAHGPFQWIKDSLVIQYVEQDPARELFELCKDPDKIRDAGLVSSFQKSTKYILENGTRVVCVASYMDQVVPVRKIL
jgi:hypothetical protein